MIETTIDQRYQIFIRVWSGFALLLFASTWKLWTPQAEFPQIPFLAILIEIPGWTDWVALALLGISLTCSLLARSRSLSTGALWLFVIASTYLILLNQHRLQPWAYQFVAFAIIMATARPKTAIDWMRWIVISIYVYSAISKLDYQFVHSVGNQLLSSWCEKIGLEITTWSEQIRIWISFTIPLTELLIGIGLLIPRVRRFAFIGAVIMHLAILTALIGNVDGPGVLIWNVFFVVQAVFLFGWSTNRKRTSAAAVTKFDKPGSDPDAPCRQRSRFPLGLVATAASWFVLVFPLTQPFGICDHWPAWQVYAPRTSRASIRNLPNESELWTQIPAWSITTLKVPVYPEARFQLAVAMAAQTRFRNSSGRPIDVSSESDRWTGARKTETLTGDQVEMHAERYWLNLKPRRLWSERGSISDSDQP